MKARTKKTTIDEIQLIYSLVLSSVNSLQGAKLAESSLTNVTGLLFESYVAGFDSELIYKYSYPTLSKRLHLLHPKTIIPSYGYIYIAATSNKSELVRLASRVKLFALFNKVNVLTDSDKADLHIELDLLQEQLND